MKSFNILICTVGRPSLQRMVDSIYPQLHEADFLTIVCDCDIQMVIPQLKDCMQKAVCTISIIKNAKVLGAYGHGSRNYWQNTLPGDYIMNADDDDVYTPDAMLHVRDTCKEKKLYIFQMQDQWTIHKSHIIKYGNIGTPMGVIPNTKDLPRWGLEFGGDFEFYNALTLTMSYEFIDTIIYRIRDN